MGPDGDQGSAITVDKLVIIGRRPGSNDTPSASLELVPLLHMNSYGRSLAPPRSPLAYPTALGKGDE
jgi:hypothetical protein